MKKLKIILLSFLVMINISNINAQKDKPQKNKAEKEAKIAALRKQYMIEKLALTDAEQKAFLPLFDEFKQKDKTLRDTFRKKWNPNQIIFMDDKKAEEMLNAMIKLKDDQNNLFKEYILKFKKVLPIKKVVMLPHIEKEFKKEVLKKAGGKNKTKDEPPATED